jgi:hypothetical protein
MIPKIDFSTDYQCANGYITNFQEFGQLYKMYGLKSLSSLDSIIG